LLSKRNSVSQTDKQKNKSILFDRRSRSVTRFDQSVTYSIENILEVFVIWPLCPIVGSAENVAMFKELLKVLRMYVLRRSLIVYYRESERLLLRRLCLFVDGILTQCYDYVWGARSVFLKEKKTATTGGPTERPSFAVYNLR